jgi:DNA polymerase III delta prime subunit
VSDGSLSPARFGEAFKAFMDAVVAASSPGNPLVERIAAHLGADPSGLPVVAEEVEAFEHPNVQVALDAYLAEGGREADLIGVAAENKRFMTLGLSDLFGRGMPGRPPPAEGPVDYVNIHLAGERVLACVQFGLYLLRDGGRRLAVLVTGPSERMGPRQKVRVEAMASRREDGERFLAALVDGMRRLNVYRGHVLSLSCDQFGQTSVLFHGLPPVGREGVVLPAGLLERIERHTVVFAEHAGALLAAGRSLKRGLLLYGPPGVGKTLTVMYLVGRMPGRTVILSTGRGMGMVQTVGQMARQLAPAMVVLEDVDLIAETRGQPFAPTGPLLFELLNEMDGLRDDRDVIFVLTTNRPDILEPALAARPGRIDLAVEVPLPDADGRRRLFELYGRGLELRGLDLDGLVERTEGVSPAYVKELLRKAALLAAAAGQGAVVTAAELDTATAELGEGGRLAERLLGFRPAADTDGVAVPAPTGFPGGATGWVSRG